MSSQVKEKEEEILNCRFLEDNEYSRLEELFRVHNDQLPNPNLSKIAIVERDSDKEIVGLFCYQLKGFAEPLWIAEDYRHNGIWLKLVEMILPLTEGHKTYMIATTVEVVEMCERLGLKRVTNPVYIKED